MEGLDQQHTSFFDSFISKKISKLGNWKCRLNERPLHVGEKRKFKKYALMDIQNIQTDLDTNNGYTNRFRRNDFERVSIAVISYYSKS